VLEVEGEELAWEELFFRGSERMSWTVTQGGGGGEVFPEGGWEWSVDALSVGARTIRLETVERIEAEVVRMTLPREVMGFGDVKLLAGIGAFLGWKAVLFVLTAGAAVGALAGVFAGILKRRDWAARIPFGPYLAGGGVWWVLGGEETVRGYWRFLDQIRSWIF
jgi:leader peptidase (prepilin peptidase)/N-methyltransferase